MLFGTTRPASTRDYSQLPGIYCTCPGCRRALWNERAGWLIGGLLVATAVLLPITLRTSSRLSDAEQQVAGLQSTREARDIELAKFGVKMRDIGGGSVWIGSTSDSYEPPVTTTTERAPHPGGSR